MDSIGSKAYMALDAILLAGLTYMYDFNGWWLVVYSECGATAAYG
jgi:hypothetical protein